jgi:hypothetical protein
LLLATISPSSSNNSNLSPNPPAWLDEIHNKLWGKGELTGEIFRKAYLTESDFRELQHKLHNDNPQRNSESYVAKNVLAVKSAFLRSKSVPVVDPAYFNTDYLVPKLVIDTSHLDEVPAPDDDVDGEDMDDDGMDDDGMDDDGMDDDGMNDDSMDDAMGVDCCANPGSHSYIASDAVTLSNRTPAAFPCTIWYLDLVELKLEHFTRVPHLMLIRSEWSDVIDIFNKRQKGIYGGAVFTGQPGIGEHRH